MGKSADELRLEIEQTRGELGNTFNAIEDRVSPKRVLMRKTERIRATMKSMKDMVMGTEERLVEAAKHGGEVIGDKVGLAASKIGDAASETTHKLADGASVVADAAHAAPGAIKRRTTGNPLAAGLILFGAGAVIASLLPSSKKEREVAGQLKDKAEPLTRSAIEAGKSLTQDIKAKAATAAKEVTDHAAAAAGSVKEEAARQAESLKNVAKDAALNAKGEVKGETNTPASSYR
ncbi:MAG: hypothetical protein NVS1B14_09500 [Vulcanimicrobiaceae bacterium]